MPRLRASDTPEFTSRSLNGNNANNPRLIRRISKIKLAVLLEVGPARSEVSCPLLTQLQLLCRETVVAWALKQKVRCGKTNARPRNKIVPGVRPPVTRSWRTSMAKRSFVQKTQRTIVGAAKSGVARVQEIDVKGITAAATAAAEIAVQAVMKSMMGREGKTRGRMTARKKPVRRTKRKSARKTSRRKRR